MASSARSLQRRLQILFLQWIVVFLTLATAVILFTLHRARDHLAKDRVLLARTVAHYADATLIEASRALERLAHDLPSGREEALLRLHSSRVRGMFREAIQLVDADGTILASDPGFAPPPPVAWLRAAETGPSLQVEQDASGRPALVAIHPLPQSSSPTFLVARTGLLGGAMSDLLQDLAIEPSLGLVLVDSSARVVAAPDQSVLFRTMPHAETIGDRILAHRPLITRGANCVACPDNSAPGDVLTILVPLTVAPWGVVLQQAEADAFAVIEPLRQGLILMTFLLALSGLHLSRRFSLGIVSPIQRLAREADKLNEGALDQPIQVEGDAEIRILAETLDSARQRISFSIEALRDLNADLERQVGERTLELRRRMDDLRDLHEQRRRLIRQLLAASEEERRRIARELHDEISQLLTVVQLSLEAVAEDENGAVAKARGLLGKTLDEIHRIIFDLRPSLLDDLGLSAAIRWYAKSQLSATGLEVALEIEEPLELAPETEIVTFRIVQEIFTNILRHAKAHQVTVELSRVGSELRLTVEDDGVGFDTEARSDGAGLVGLRERAELLGGSLEIDSAPGQGTSVQFSVHLEVSPA